nr:Uncharacterised protein [Streptococcus thermophilus]
MGTLRALRSLRGLGWAAKRISTRSNKTLTPTLSRLGKPTQRRHQRTTTHNRLRIIKTHHTPNTTQLILHKRNPRRPTRQINRRIRRPHPSLTQHSTRHLSRTPNRSRNHTIKLITSNQHIPLPRRRRNRHRRRRRIRQHLLRLTNILLQRIHHRRRSRPQRIRQIRIIMINLINNPPKHQIVNRTTPQTVIPLRSNHPIITVTLRTQHSNIQRAPTKIKHSNMLPLSHLLLRRIMNRRRTRLRNHPQLRPSHTSSLRRIHQIPHRMMRPPLRMRQRHRIRINTSMLRPRPINNAPNQRSKNHLRRNIITLQLNRLMINKPLRRQHKTRRITTPRQQRRITTNHIPTIRIDINSRRHQIRTMTQRNSLNRPTRRTRMSRSRVRSTKINRQIPRTSHATSSLTTKTATSLTRKHRVRRPS